MKTVLQEFIEQLEKTIPEIKNGNAVDKLFWLQKEKEQIIEAVTYGQNNHSVSILSDLECANEYYNSTFGDSKEAGI